jgi:hypothetical protein
VDSIIRCTVVIAVFAVFPEIISDPPLVSGGNPRLPTPQRTKKQRDACRFLLFSAVLG